MTDKIVIFTDGASKGNPGPGGWGAIVKVGGKVVELGGRVEHTTNNRMELTAAIRALDFIKEIPGEAVVYTDSSYLAGGITKWVYSWERRNWTNTAKQPVLNKDLWEDLLSLVRARGKVEWRVLPGHVGIPANERADQIASLFGEGTVPALVSMPESQYPVSFIVPSGDNANKKRGKKGKAYSYVSQVDGTIETHATWEECKRRVEGRQGARFKKALSKEEERDIINSWRR